MPEPRWRIELPGRAPFELRGGERVVVGSSEKRAQLVLAGAGIDAAHCALVPLPDGGLEVRDLGSAGGTRVNGAACAQRRLAHGDRIELGAQQLRVLDSAAVAGSAAPAAAAAAASPAAATSAAARANAPRSAAASAPARAAGPLETPQVPGYRLERRLGRGAMGDVWLALQTSLDRKVALKLLDAQLAADADYVRRFQAEARAAAALTHPNVVVVFDVGQAGQQPYLTMEYMEGGSLEARLAAQGKLPWREVHDALRDAARGLAFAEQRHLVHRDIKPGNLMRGPGGVVKIADLGLAASSHPDALAAQQEGDKKVFGTPHFIAPEQARGEPPSHRSDLYSLGATAYQLLSGRTPHQGANSREILRSLFQQEPPALATLVPDCPRELVAAIERLMQKDAAQRTPDARALLSELEALPAAGAAPAAPARGSRALLWVGGAAALAAASALAYLALRPASTASAPAPELAARGASAPGAAPALDAAHAGAPPQLPSAEPTAQLDAQQQQKLRELEAQLALRDAPPRSEAAARSAALSALIERYAGTQAAELALVERDELARASQASQGAQQQAEQQAAGAAAALRARVGVEPASAELPALVHALVELVSPAIGVEMAADPAVAPAVAAYEAELWSALLARCESARTQTEEHARAGEFEAARAALAPLLELAELPPVNPRVPAERLAQLEQARAWAAQRAAALGDEQARFGAERGRADEQRLALALRGDGGAAAGLAPKLARLELRAAAAELRAAAAQLGDEQRRARAERFAGELEEAAAALELLVQSFDAGQWKRRSIKDPRPGREQVRDVLGLGAEGLRIKGELGEEKLPWQLFSERPDALAGLFAGRLAREWTPAEQQQIAALLRLCAARLSASLVEPALGSASQKPFSPADQARVDAAFASAREFTHEPAALGRLEAERATAQALAAAALARSTHRPASAAIWLARALGEGRETWTLAWLSDGSAVEEDAFERAPAPRASSSAPAPAGGDKP